MNGTITRAVAPTRAREQMSIIEEKGGEEDNGQVVRMVVDDDEEEGSETRVDARGKTKNEAMGPASNTADSGPGSQQPSSPPGEPNAVAATNRSQTGSAVVATPGIGAFFADPTAVDGEGNITGVDGASASASANNGAGKGATVGAGAGAAATNADAGAGASKGDDGRLRGVGKPGQRRRRRPKSPSKAKQEDLEGELTYDNVLLLS